MEKMNKAFEKMKMMVGMEVEDEEQQAAALDNESSFAFMDDFNRNCTLTTKQVFSFSVKIFCSNSIIVVCLVSGRETP
jgi:hypothetical protein